ncbi:WD40 repeat-like protein [Eremomyces bilateralis CBS 781.70]|uniref:WD40 repeat-like protein n=1 Tax=Eremomyces bilateralis CBS 781.70 TaxID=1392243 RepID=A0A6G1FW12_9PEZI|nr:WD40 repeat-like protein [Eremomyces bilateralis CBS 781.70]KAF1809963.1 WD40 repeat-like protein [Eremomyces bilateralis CBS 781.70]
MPTTRSQVDNDADPPAVADSSAVLMDSESEDTDDFDYQPASERREAENYSVDDEDEEDDEDADENLIVDFQFNSEDEEDDLGDLDDLDEDQTGEQAEGGDGDDGRGPLYVTREQLLQILGHSGGLGGFLARQLSDMDEIGGEYWGRRRRKRSGPRGPSTFDAVPSEAGQKLMNSGKFGSVDRNAFGYRRKKKFSARLFQRELGMGSYGTRSASNSLISRGMVPSTDTADMIIHYNHRCYSGQFSDDGNFFFTCCQDFKVRMYDTSNPYDWKYYKSVDHHGGSWTLTDASLSPDNRFLAYSSMQPTVCMASTDPESETTPFQLDFTQMGQTARRPYHDDRHFGIWSVRFSGDGRELVAGTGNNSVYVYDLETRKTVLRIRGHHDDVNAVCYGDKQSPHILYSGSDDATIKVWDRRSLGDGRPAGVFLGHTEGVTYVDSKGDGRYVLSNAKDQTAKLWDLRKTMSADEAGKINTLNDYSSGFDYRQERYDVSQYTPHKNDCSLVTFRGHSVLWTLIRCHFSPPTSSGGSYVYSGSRDGNVYIWNMDATLAGKIDVQNSTMNTRPDDEEMRTAARNTWSSRGNMWMACVRDASWHPSAPVIAGKSRFHCFAMIPCKPNISTATAWNGRGAVLGTASVHTWGPGTGERDEGPTKVNGQLKPVYSSERSGSSPIRRRRRRTVADDTDDEMPGLV